MWEVQAMGGESHRRRSNVTFGAVGGTRKRRAPERKFFWVRRRVRITCRSKGHDPTQQMPRVCQSLLTLLRRLNAKSC